MKNLTTCRGIAHTYGKPYRQVIYEYLADYRSTPHSSTGKTPVALIFNYSCYTSNLPYIRYKQTYRRDNQVAEHNDALAKEQMKQQKEIKGHFGYQNFKADEEVRVKLRTKQSKNIPPNTIETFIIKDVLGTQIRSERTNPDGKITTCTRDDSFFKRTHKNANLSSESMDGVDLIIQPAEPINTSNQNTEHDVVEHEITEQTTTEPAPVEQTATKRATKQAQKQLRTEPTNSRQSPRPIRIRAKPNWLQQTNPNFNKTKVTELHKSGRLSKTNKTGKDDIILNKISLNTAIRQMTKQRNDLNSTKTPNISQLKNQ